MKKYIPSQMIRRSRFSTFYETWGEKEKEQLVDWMKRLIAENPEYVDSGNYGHLCKIS